MESAWWAWNSAEVQYPLKRAGSPLRDLYRQPADGGAARTVADAERAALDAPDPVYDATRSRMAYVRDGNVFVRDLRSGALTQLSRSNAAASRPQFAVDGGLIWRAGNDWYHWNAATGTTQAAVPKAERDPAAPPKADTLREHQLSVLATLRRDREQKDALRGQAEALRRADPSRAPAPLYFGNDVDIVDSALSPDGRHLLVVTQAKGGDEGKSAPLPRYVTESGPWNRRRRARWSAATTRCHRRCGCRRRHRPGCGRWHWTRCPASPRTCWPRCAGRRPARAEGQPAVRIETDGDGSGPATGAPTAARPRCCCARWTTKTAGSPPPPTATPGLRPRHRLTDPAWINWTFNDFGWLPDNRTLWLLSEQSGWSRAVHRRHRRQGEAAQRRRPLGSLAAAAQRRRRRLPVPVQPRTADPLRGLPARPRQRQGGGDHRCRAEEFSSSPDGRRLLVRHSSAYLPAQLAVVPADGGAATPLTDTRTADGRARAWA